VCSGFPKRSCSIKDLKRDDDPTQSHRALAWQRLIAEKAALRTAERARQIEIIGAMGYASPRSDGAKDVDA
jgi:hypothetical protein